MRSLSFFVALGAVVAVVLWQSGWSPFTPRDYEECIESAAKNAKSADALSLLVSSCSSKFVARRDVIHGGYTYYDGRQSLSFKIAGPNPTTEEWANIEKQYAKYLDGRAAAEEAQRRQEAQQQQMAAIAQAEEARKVQLAQADLERRKQIALKRISITSADFTCLYPLLDGCDSYKLSAYIKNQSSESISALSLGWVFIEQAGTCPSSVPTKTQEWVRLRPGDTLVLNLDQRFDGPPTKKFRYCLEINDAQIAE